MAGGTCRRFCSTLLAKKAYDADTAEQTNLKRCLGKWEVCALGVGSGVGVGVYFISGHVARHLAGPSVVIAFLIAAAVALFAGLCYAELSARAPRAGGAYNYTHVALGELAAFVIAWNNILCGLCGTAGMARLLSAATDAAFNASMSEWVAIEQPHNVVSPYFDVIAFVLILVMGGLLSFGVRESSLINAVLVAVSVGMVLLIIIVGAIAADSSNWDLPLESIPEGEGVGGFFPFGVLEMLKGAAICVYGFIGFDTICAAGEEAVSPRRVIPLSLLAMVGVTLLCYCGVSLIITLITPYHHLTAVLWVPEAFASVGWVWARWVFAVGSLLALYCSVFGSLYGVSRLLYAVCAEGRVWWLRRVASRAPASATITAAVLAALLGGLFAARALLQLAAIGLLLSWTAVAVAVIVLRYNCDYTPGKARYTRQVLGLVRAPTRASCRVVNVALLLFIIVSVINGVIITHTEGWRAVPWLASSSAAAALALMAMLVMAVQPQVHHDLDFKTPLVPLVPCVSIYINVHLMVLNVLDYHHNWLILGLWIIIGIIIYLFSICCCQQPQKNHLQDNITQSYPMNNGKAPVQIIVESPTPPDTLNRISNYGGNELTEETIQQDAQSNIVRNELPVIEEEITLHQASIENNEEKEAKIIDLLDQVLQAEEDSYGEAISLKEINEDDTATAENTIQRKSLSELSDAGSDASLGNQGLSKYDVIAQVHREDMPRVNEEEEKIDTEAPDNDENDDHEQVTAFNDSDTNSRTDESGYSDTLDRNALSESLEESREEIPTIPVPPPFDENYFRSPNFRKSYTIGTKHRNLENKEEDAGSKPRESIKSIMSNGSQPEDNITFGSDRQIHFMSKLNNIFQNKISNEDDEPRKRSHSTGNVVENTEYSVSRERNPLFLALKDEIIAKEAAQNLRPVNSDEKENVTKDSDPTESVEAEEAEEESLSKEELKSKLENIFAAGGPQLLKPRLMKSNPPTPEDSYPTDTSSTESIPKLPKLEKNDTLKRQKAKFNEVLNSFRISLNQEDAV